MTRIQQLTLSELHFAEQDAEPAVPALWFVDLGVRVFPTSNKVPAIPKGTSWQDYPCTREQAARFTEYGVPLGGPLAVVDTDALDVEAWIAAHVPPTPFMVRTKRGWHRYYRLAGDAPHFIHRDGLTIEFKHRGQYVVGPRSRRPDGVVYTPDSWSWNIDDVPWFPVNDFDWDDRPPGERGSGDGEPFAMPDVVRAGERHEQLFRFLRSCKHYCDRDETRALVTMANRKRCVPPLEEDEQFERWFERQWRKPDRPFTPTEAPLSGLGDLRGL